MNIWTLPERRPGREVTETLCASPGVRIERIVSTGQASPPGFWYDQAQDEWVALLQGQAELMWYDGRRRILRPGDWLLIPAHERHRVAWTSPDQPCIWLAVFGQLR